MEQIEDYCPNLACSHLRKKLNSAHIDILAKYSIAAGILRVETLKTTRPA